MGLASHQLLRNESIHLPATRVPLRSAKGSHASIMLPQKAKKSRSLKKLRLAQSNEMTYHEGIIPEKLTYSFHPDAVISACLQPQT